MPANIPLSFPSVKTLVLRKSPICLYELRSCQKIGTQKIYNCVEAERVQSDETGGLPHDAFTRQLHRLFPGADRLWLEVRGHIDVTKGSLICDDSASDKFYSQKIELVTCHWSGKHKRAMSGINLITLLRTDGGRCLPTDYRIYKKSSDGLTRNDHFKSMLQKAAERGLGLNTGVRIVGDMVCKS